MTDPHRPPRPRRASLVLSLAAAAAVSLGGTARGQTTGSPQQPTTQQYEDHQHPRHAQTVRVPKEPSVRNPVSALETGFLNPLRTLSPRLIALSLVGLPVAIGEPGSSGKGLLRTPSRSVLPILP